VHESDVSPSSHFAAMQHVSRIWSEADISSQTKPAHSVENEPTATKNSLSLVAAHAMATCPFGVIRNRVEPATSPAMPVMPRWRPEFHALRQCAPIQ
jgi:hypothetical protein